MHAIRAIDLLAGYNFRAIDFHTTMSGRPKGWPPVHMALEKDGQRYSIQVIDTELDETTQTVSILLETGDIVTHKAMDRLTRLEPHIGTMDRDPAHDV